MEKIRKGQYLYNEYLLTNCGYHAPDHCIWWEASKKETGLVVGHVTTRKGLKQLIDKKIQKN